MAKLLGNQDPVTTQIGEVTQGLGFDLLPVDEVSGGGGGLTNPVSFIEYQNSNPNPAYLEGRVFYDMDRNALSYYNNESDTTINIGQETVFEVSNTTGFLIPNGTAVRVQGSVGGYPSILPALADDVSNANVAGVTTHDIPDGETGYLTIFGQVGGIDTSLFAAGDFLYLSASVQGELVNVEQEILSPVAQVLTVGVSGDIVVRPRGVINLTAIGQVAKQGGPTSQAINASIVPLECFTNVSTPLLNMTHTFTAGSGAFTAELAPSAAGASGFYQVNISIAGTFTLVNEDVVITVGVNGAPTNLFTVLPFDGLQAGDTASAALSGYIETPVTDSDQITVLVNATGGSGTFSPTQCFFSAQRLGNA